MMKKTKQVVREIVFKTTLVLRWPIAISLVAIGLLLNTYLFSQVRCLTEESPPHTSQAKLRWSGPGSDGGPILPFPSFDSNSSGVRSPQTCEPFKTATVAETLMGATMAAVGWSLFIFAFALVRFPNGTRRTRLVTIIAAWGFLATTQIFPWEYHLTDHPAPPEFLIAIYNVIVGGLLFWIILRFAKKFRAYDIGKII